VSIAVDIRSGFRIYPSHGGAVAALQGLDLAVEHGEVVVALGPSGSGKTTLLRVIAGFEQLSAGSVRVLGTDLARLGSRARAAFRAENVGFLDQHYTRSLPRGLSCRRVVALGLELRGEDPTRSRATADRLLERVGLRDRAEERPQVLSGGEQQRVALCAAVAHRPKLLLADEPGGELDDRSARTVYGVLADLARESGSTLVIVSHDSAAETIADRIVTISDGRTVSERSPGRRSALVASSGWVRMPEAYLRDAGAPRRMLAERRECALVLRPLDGARPSDALLQERGRSTLDGVAVEPVAELRDVTKSYSAADRVRVVLAGATLRVLPGRVLAVVGRSGSGKTTVLHLLAGLESPSEGDVLVVGTSLAGSNRSELALLRRAHVALVSQEPGLIPYLTAAENVGLGLRLRDARDDDATVETVLEEVGLDARMRQPMSVLSAGERQRVAVARALVSRAELVLVDEPTARLDRENGLVVGKLLVRAAREEGRAVLVATHDADLIEHADDVVVLRDGRLATDRAREPVTAPSA
jgi:ABC-type lipoprotein export system ATPase subunit